MAGSLARYQCLGLFATLSQISTLNAAFPHLKIFQEPKIAMSCGVISLHRRSNPPAEESGDDTVKNSATRDGAATRKLLQWMHYGKDFEGAGASSSWLGKSGMTKL
jgi:hypothetical protein